MVISRSGKTFCKKPLHRSGSCITNAKVNSFVNGYLYLDILSPFRRTPKAAAGRSLASRFYQFNECLSCCYNSVVVTMLGSKNFGSIELFFDFTAFNVEVFRGYCLDFRQRLGVRFPLSKHYSYLAPIFDRLG